uniref:DNA-directed RNA polymerase n=1 Tax=Termitomyces sp. K1Aa TaxID=2724994 RepID=A0A8F1D6E9_9AGAR|nr:RNA polymerase [Termitomyces sp. K1Aa]
MKSIYSHFFKVSNAFESNKIVACFARGLDKPHMDRGRVHLIGSVFNFSLEGEISRKKNVIDFWKNEIYQKEEREKERGVPNSLESLDKDRIFIFEVEESLGKDCFLIDILNFQLNKVKGKKDFNIFHVFQSKDFSSLSSRYLEEIKRNRLDIVGYSHEDPRLDVFPIDSDKYQEIKVLVRSVFISIEELFTKFLANADRDHYYHNSVFIFYEINWSNIILQSKIYGVDISGGNPSKRHLLTSADYRLAEFLIEFSKVNPIYSNLNSTIQSDLKDPFLMTETPSDEYTKFLKSNSSSKESLKNFLELVNKTDEDVEKSFEEKYRNEGEDMFLTRISNKEEEEWSDFKLAYEVLNLEKLRGAFWLMQKNLLLHFRLSAQIINKGYKSLVQKLKDELQECETNANNNQKLEGEEKKILILKNLISEKEKEFLNFKENSAKLNYTYLRNLIRKVIKDEENFDNKKTFNLRHITNCGKEGERFKSLGAKLKKNTEQRSIVGSNQKNPNFKRHYSSVSSRTDRLEENIDTLEEVLIDSKYLRDNFLKNVSNFGLEMRKIVNQVKDVNTEEDKFQIQTRVEAYCLEFEERIVDNLIINSESENKFDPLVASLILDWNDKLVKALNDFIHGYEINNYENLIKEIEKNNGRGELFLIIFALKYKIKEKNLKLEQKMEKKKANLAHLKKQTKDKKIYERYGRFIECEISPVVSLIISNLVNIISNHKKYDKKDNSLENLNISLASLRSLLGEAILKRTPKEVPKLFFECNKIKLEKENIKLIKEFYEKNIKCNNCEETIFTIGNSLFELVINTVDIFEVYGPIYEKGKSNKYVQIKESYLTNLSKKLAHPMKLPMIIPPKDWDLSKDSKEKIGGFLNFEYNSLINNNLIHKSRKNLGESELSDAQADAINFLNSQKFKINKEILTFLLKEFKEKDSYIFQGKNVIHPETANFIKLDLNKKKEISAHNSKFNLYKNILTLAVVYENVDFYLPTYFDFRGRIYSVVDYLTYQGEDISRSLIEFSNGCDLDTENVLYVLQYLANTSGKSKLNVLNKTKWAIEILNNLNILTSQLTRDNLDILFNSNSFRVCDFNLNDLINNFYIRELLVDNDDKLQFLATLLSLIKFLLKKSPKFYTPICFDATCSGFQHLSSIFLDIEMAVTSNVSNFLIKAEELDLMEGFKKEDIKNIKQKTEPGDVYMKVAETVKTKISEIEKKDETFKDKLSKLNINRNLLKRPVMTVPYNVGLNTMGDQLIHAGFFKKHVESLSKEKDKEIQDLKGKVPVHSFYTISPKIIKEEFKKEIITLSASEMGRFFSILYFAVYNTFPSLKKYITYLNEFAVIFGKLKAPIVWTTPVGMRVKLAYADFKTKRGKNLFDSKKRNSVSLPILGKMDHKANKSSFVPNLIHSMDSANIQLLIRNLRLNSKYKNFNLFTIHDCFATTPDAMKILNLEVRKAFSLMYFDERYLNVLHLDFLREINRYTTIYKEEKGKTTPYVLFSSYENCTLFIVLQKTKKEKVRIDIPKLPFDGNWEVVKEIFEAGITNSLYFIS